MASMSGVGFFDSSDTDTCKNTTQMLAYIKLLNLIEIRKLDLKKKCEQIYGEAKACGLHIPTMKRVVINMTRGYQAKNELMDFTMLTMKNEGTKNEDNSRI